MVGRGVDKNHVNTNSGEGAHEPDISMDATPTTHTPSSDPSHRLPASPPEVSVDAPRARLGFVFPASSVFLERHATSRFALHFLIFLPLALFAAALSSAMVPPK